MFLFCTYYILEYKMPSRKTEKIINIQESMTPLYYTLASLSCIHR